MEPQGLIDVTNFMKLKNHFNQFLNVFSFFNTFQCILFWHKYFNITSYEKQKNVQFIWHLKKKGFDLP